MHFAMFLKWKSGEINRKTQNKIIISSSAVDLPADFRSIPAGAARPPAYRGKVTVYRKMVAKLRRIEYNTDADISSEAASSPIPVSVPYGST